MHCADCYSENMRMVGSISSPGWQCADCGSTKPPVHAHDRLPEAESAEQEHHVSTEILETCKPAWQGYDPGAGDITTMWAIAAETDETQSFVRRGAGSITADKISPCCRCGNSQPEYAVVGSAAGNVCADCIEQYGVNV